MRLVVFTHLPLLLFLIQLVRDQRVEDSKEMDVTHNKAMMSHTSNPHPSRQKWNEKGSRRTMLNLPKLNTIQTPNKMKDYQTQKHKNANYYIKKVRDEKVAQHLWRIFNTLMSSEETESGELSQPQPYPVTRKVVPTPLLQQGTRPCQPNPPAQSYINPANLLFRHKRQEQPIIIRQGSDQTGQLVLNLRSPESTTKGPGVDGNTLDPCLPVPVPLPTVPSPMTERMLDQPTIITQTFPSIQSQDADAELYEPEWELFLSLFFLILPFAIAYLFYSIFREDLERSRDLRNRGNERQQWWAERNWSNRVHLRDQSIQFGRDFFLSNAIVRGLQGGIGRRLGQGSAPSAGAMPASMMMMMMTTTAKPEMTTKKPAASTEKPKPAIINLPSVTLPSIPGSFQQPMYLLNGN